MDKLQALYIFLSFWIWAAVGSFINAAAMRTMAEKKWWGSERSVCDSCKRVLAVYELIPVVSYLALGGKCRTCNKSIPIQHLMAEVGLGITAAFFVWFWGAVPALIFSLAMIPFLLFHTITDIESGYIYDSWAIAMLVLGLLLRLGGGWYAVLDGALGAALGFGVILAIIIVSRGGMGFGDAMLMLGIGAFFGWKMTVLAMYAGFMTGGVVILPLLAMKKVSRKSAVPLGPFLCAGAIIAAILGQTIFSRFDIDLLWPWL